ncbi:MAG: ABC transporter ATP-binding protein, partial [Candidatus Omnitrophica bacterium]|nr:ABC transporter ATP-binding protein [Candidatus Omnitrophota bacterium]
MIKIENMTKIFGDLIAVNDLCLNIPQGEFFAFLGPNAAGKTTTIKLLTGLLKPSAGRISICGLDIEKDYCAAKALISYIPDMPFLYDKLTGREFLEFIRSLYPRSGTCAEEQLIDELLDVFSLKGCEYQLIEFYSHGMRQKLVFAAALLHSPKVMIIDEPMVGLDQHANRLVKDILKQKT